MPHWTDPLDGFIVFIRTFYPPARLQGMALSMEVEFSSEKLLAI
jgi:hypothetical protein